MGYRCNLLTEEIYQDLPDSFKDKWKDEYNIESCISSMSERKGHYSILEDLQKILKKNSWRDEVLLVGVLLWEDGYIRPFKLYPDRLEQENSIFTAIHEDNL